MERQTDAARDQEDARAARRALARARLEWLVELGADEAVGESSVDRYALPPDEAAPPLDPQPAPRTASEVASRPASPSPRAAAPAHVLPPAPAPAASTGRAPVLAGDATVAAAAEGAAGGAADLAALAAAMQVFPSDLKATARQFVFADGTPGAPLMVIGEAPGRDEDRVGRPFVGAAGQLLDRMLQAIGRDRTDPDPARAVYIVNVVPWRPVDNATPSDAEVVRWRPFLLRHVELARPRVLLLTGNTPARALLGRGGITTLRGRWQEAAGLPAMPTFHPSYVLRLEDRPADLKAARRQVWEDLQAVQARLAETVGGVEP